VKSPNNAANRIAVIAQIVRTVISMMIVFLIGCRNMTHNVLELLAERFETLSTEMLLTKITVSTHLQSKINVFPEGTAFANALVSALFANCC
jgi:hypothetical protein